MLMPSIFGEDLFDDWMRLPVERETNRGYRTTELMKTDIKDVDGNYELSMEDSAEGWLPEHPGFQN